MTTLEFSAMVQQYQSLVYTVCHQLVPDEGDAQDLTQETFLAAWRAIDRCPVRVRKAVAGTHRCQQSKGLSAQRMGAPGEHPRRRCLALEGAPPGTEPEQQVLDALGEEELTA